MTIHTRPVIGSLYPLSSPSRSGTTAFSSVSLSPNNPNIGVASSKDILHVLRLNLAGGNATYTNRLEEVKSVRISQHFLSAVQTVNSSGAGTNPYPHLRDVLRPPGAGPSSVSRLSTPSVSGGGGVNINIMVMDVAWSMPQSYVVDDEAESPTNNADTWPRTVGADVTASVLPHDSYLELISQPDTEHQHPSYQPEHHYPSFIRRRFMSVEDHSDVSPHGVGDASVVVAGSNGVIVAWNASSLLSAQSSNSNSRNSMASPHQRATSATFGPHEASFLAHSRAVNRLAWHPTGRRPYLLLTASQDGSVKLWDRRASSSLSVHAESISSIGSNLSLAQPMAKNWFGFGNFGASSSQAVQNVQLPPLSEPSRTATWHCISTYQPKCDAVRDICWNPLIDDVFAMVAGEWLCIYDIRINKPMVRESTHAGDASCVDWHPSKRFVVATGGGRDKSVKVWDFESSLNLCKHDDSSYFMKANSASYTSTKSAVTSASQTSDDDLISSPSDILSRNSQTVDSNFSTSFTPMKRYHKKKLPIHVLNIAAPVTRIRWRPAEDEDDVNDFIAVATASIYGATSAGGNGTAQLWSCVRSTFMPLSVCEGHTEGAVNDLVWVPIDGNAWQTIFTVGRNQCLLQNFSHGEQPILDVPRATFALANLSPFQPGFGSLQIMSVHQKVNAPDLIDQIDYLPRNHEKSDLVFSITDQGDVEDLNNTALHTSADVASELTHLSRFSELYATKIGGGLISKADICQHNASVADGLNQKAISQMWKTLSVIIDGSGLNALPTSASNTHSNPMTRLLIPTLRNLLLQRADYGDVQTVVVLCEVMDVIAPPPAAGGSARSRIPKLNITHIREWYLAYIDLLQQMCLFTQAASLIRNCSDPTIGALNQQSTTIHDSCPQCGKPLTGGSTTIQDGVLQLSAQRICRSCRSTIGHCFICHEPVKGIFVGCPGCGHGGHLDHALEWFGSNEFCPTGCGHKCNLFKNQA